MEDNNTNKFDVFICYRGQSNCSEFAARLNTELKKISFIRTFFAPPLKALNDFSFRALQWNSPYGEWNNFVMKYSHGIWNVLRTWLANFISYCESTARGM